MISGRKKTTCEVRDRYPHKANRSAKGGSAPRQNPRSEEKQCVSFAPKTPEAVEKSKSEFSGCPA